MHKRVSHINKTTNIYCITPFKSFATNNWVGVDDEYISGKFYFAFGIKICCDDNFESEQVLVFKEDYSYSLFEKIMAKRFFKYVRDYPILKQIEQIYINKLNEITKIKLREI